MDQERVETFLDALGSKPIDTFQMAHELRLVMEVFPDVNWPMELRRAFCRQEQKDGENNKLRTLAQHMASELLGFNET